jgi:hypothetical protein
LYYIYFYSNNSNGASASASVASGATVSSIQTNLPSSFSITTVVSGPDSYITITNRNITSSNYYKITPLALSFFLPFGSTTPYSFTNYPVSYSKLVVSQTPTASLQFNAKLSNIYTSLSVGSANLNNELLMIVGITFDSSIL